MSDIKNADSFLWEQDFTTASTTYYSPWFDVGFANVLYSFLTFEETGTAGSESITVTVERFMPYPDLDAVLTASSTALEVLGHSAIGAADVGLIDVATSGVLAAGANLLRVDSSGANTAASFAVEIIVSGTVAGSTLGTALNITDTGAVAGTSYAAYINSTNNSGLNIVTGAVDMNNLVMTGLAAQAASMVVLDGTTGTGWDGADDVGMLEINTLIQQHTGATCMLVETEVAPIAGAEGACARFIQSGGLAVTDGYLVQIEATTLGGALHVDTGFVTFDEALTVGTTLGVTGAATFTAGQQSLAVTLAAVATNGVATPAGTTFVNVTSDGADKIIDLPTPVLGNVVYYMESTATGYELAPQADTQYINNTLCGSAKELAVAAAKLVRAVCIIGGASGKWYVSLVNNDGTVSGGGTPD